MNLQKGATSVLSFTLGGKRDIYQSQHKTDTIWENKC